MAIHKLRTNNPLTETDLVELERMLIASGAGGAEDIAQAKVESQRLSLFVRGFVGMDREAAKQTMASFLNQKALSANQIEFVNLIVNHLTEHDTVHAAELYGSRFTDLTPRGPAALFGEIGATELIAVFEAVPLSAAAA